MKNALNSAAVMLLCMFSLFFVQPDLLYVTAFLFAVIVCCADFFSGNDRIFGLTCLIFFLTGLMDPDSVLFFPAAGYGLFRRRLYPAASAGGLLFCIALFRAGIARNMTDVSVSSGAAFPLLLICLELFGFLTAFLLAEETRTRKSLENELRRIQDDSTERDLLLTEKNRSIQEKQDYEIYAATLRERNRIAREIHDNVGHLLSRSILLVGAAKAVSKDAALAPTLDSLDTTLNSAMNSIRTSVHDLRDEAVNLEEAVRSLVSNFTFCPVRFQYDAGRTVPRDAKYAFISISKEALSNIMRHSNATEAVLTIREHPALYQLCIEDNGTMIRKSENGMGLSNMRDRVEKLGGNIHFSDGKGFRILATIPKRRQNDETDTDR
ncbi:sensor histidine kinase [Mediterraneibacter glycyrrhizinilyticus]|nr:histidine kinase [Mediterraneibacter glycyrrhizinilyticus]MBM6750709.1 sensor histidine kinase [Mediterraneibacter glycyrrhizinilyticus]